MIQTDGVDETEGFEREGYRWIDYIIYIDRIGDGEIEEGGCE
jgi:hypothetical protein